MSGAPSWLLQVIPLWLTKVILKKKKKERKKEKEKARLSKGADSRFISALVTAERLLVSIVILVCRDAFDQSRQNYEHTASLQFVTQVSPYLNRVLGASPPEKKKKNKQGCIQIDSWVKKKKMVAAIILLFGFASSFTAHC